MLSVHESLLFSVAVLAEWELVSCEHLILILHVLSNVDVWGIIRSVARSILWKHSYLVEVKTLNNWLAIVTADLYIFWIVIFSVSWIAPLSWFQPNVLVAQELLEQSGCQILLLHRPVKALFLILNVFNLHTCGIIRSCQGCVGETLQILIKIGACLGGVLLSGARLTRSHIVVILVRHLIHVVEELGQERVFLWVGNRA